MPGTPLKDILNGFGVEFPCGGKGSCGKCKIRVLEGEIETDPIHRERLNELNLDDPWRLACLSTCNADLELEIGQFETIIQADNTHFEFTPGEGLGIAFDLGTTTLVGQLLDLESGEILAVETALNPQRKYGSDLVSRLEASMAQGTLEMTEMIRDKMGKMTRKMMKGRGEDLERMVIVGNTVMHHFFCGHDIKPLSFYPFSTPMLGKVLFSSGELSWDHLNCNRIEFYPSIASFVGSDILAGILTTGMHARDSYSVLVDLGTNGEIVAGNKHRLLCSSTAAGPAFEGARISQGMQAVTGAISSVSLSDEGWTCKVIGNTDSKGICGSGLIDALQILRKRRLVGEFGEIMSGDDAIALDDRVQLTQKDIQEFQLAKAAISAGLEILIERLGIGKEEVEEVYIAGGFGNFINLESLTGIGMMDFPVEKIRKLGNTALMGAKLFLFENCKDPGKILKLCEHVSLEAEDTFQDIFIEHLSL